MKCLIGTLALLLLSATVAVGQQYQPFPMAANPSLQADANGATPNLPVELRQTLPSSMSANQGGEPEGMVSSHGDEIVVGSPFPAAAAPSKLVNTERHGGDWHEIQSGSAFPSAANPFSE